VADTTIEWTGRPGTKGVTLNPTTGCDKISPGCGLPRLPGDQTGGCYAMALAKRLKAMGSAKYQNDGDPRTSGPGFGLTLHPEVLTEPLRWRDPRTVFVNSMSDLFHAKVPRDFLARFWAVMAATPQHCYQILTKRPERMARIIGDPDFRRSCEPWRVVGDGVASEPDWPLPGVWLGTSVEMADYLRRIDHLRATPAAVRFVSAEPLLGPLDGIDLADIDWLIVGGESGPGARPMDLGWVRDLRDACAASGTALFVKQMGSVWARRNGQPGKGNHWDTWPDDLKIRQYPATGQAVAA
jgi:protein gp37